MFFCELIQNQFDDINEDFMVFEECYLIFSWYIQGCTSSWQLCNARSDQPLVPRAWKEMGIGSGLTQYPKRSWTRCTFLQQMARILRIQAHPCIHWTPRYHEQRNSQRLWKILRISRWHRSVVSRCRRKTFARINGGPYFRMHHWQTVQQLPVWWSFLVRKRRLAQQFYAWTVERNP